MQCFASASKKTSNPRPEASSASGAARLEEAWHSWCFVTNSRATFPRDGALFRTPGASF